MYPEPLSQHASKTPERVEATTLEEDSWVDKKWCVVCLDAAKSHMFQPCHHLCVCKACSRAIMASSDRKCPLCRSKVAQCERVYM